MKLKHLVLLAAAFMMTFNMMSLSVNAAAQEEEDLSKGSIFAWCAVMLATGKTTQQGLSQFTTIAKVNEFTKAFYSDKWLAERFNDAMVIFKGQGEGTEGLIKRMPSLFKSFKKMKVENRVGFMLSLIVMAKHDNNVSKEEADVIEKIVKVIDISRDELLMAWMIWIQR